MNAERAYLALVGQALLAALAVADGWQSQQTDDDANVFFEDTLPMLVQAAQRLRQTIPPERLEALTRI